MPLKIKCRCGTVLTVPAQRISKAVRCPSCSETVVIQPTEKRQTKPKIDTNKSPAKAADAQEGKTATPEEEKGEAAKLKGETLKRKPASNKCSETEVNKGRKAPEPHRHEDDKPQEKRIQAGKPGTTAEKLPPALKRASSSGKEGAKEKADTTSRPEKPTAPTDKPQTPASGMEKEKQPPPLKPRPSSAKAKPPAKAAEATQTKVATPPLRKPPANRRTDSKRRPEKTLPKRKAHSKRKKASKKPSVTAPEQTPPRGVEHDPAKRWSAYYLAIGVIFVALFNMGPAFYEGFQAFRLDPPRPMARWAYAAVVVSFVQLAYSFYLIQLPDWGSVWVVAILSLVATTMYAALASAVVFGGQDSNLLESLQLTYVARKKAMLWCTIMLTLSALLTYFGGRLGIRWHIAFSIAYPTTTTRSSS